MPHAPRRDARRDDHYNIRTAVPFETATTLSGNVSLASATTIGGYGDITLNGVISGNYGLTVAGTCTLTLAGNNSNYNGAITIYSNGTLRASSATAIGGNSSTVTVNLGGTLNLNGQNISTTQTLTLKDGGVGGYGALVNNDAQSSFAGTVVLAAATTIGGSGNIALSGVISGRTTANLNKSDNATLTLSGINTYSSDRNITSGTLVVSGTGTLGSSKSLNISEGTVTTTSTVLEVNKLTISGGKLNLNNHDLIWHSTNTSTDMDTVRGWLYTGYGTTGIWDGVTGITSTAWTDGYGYGIMSGAFWNAISNSATFHGLDVSANDILVKYTRVGDTTFKDSVDATDFAQLDAAYLKGTYTSGGAKWLNGDCNYDGKIDATDFAKMNHSFTVQSGGGGQAPVTTPPETTTTGTTTTGTTTTGTTTWTLPPGSTNALYAVALVSADWVPTASDLAALGLSPAGISSILDPVATSPAPLASAAPSADAIAVSNAFTVCPVGPSAVGPGVLVPMSSATTTPEPATLGLLGAGAAILLTARRRAYRRQAPCSLGCPAPLGNLITPPAWVYIHPCAWITSPSPPDDSFSSDPTSVQSSTYHPHTPPQRAKTVILFLL